MGFWHTGYFEFHEEVGLPPWREPSPRRYPCVHCDATYASIEDLRQHRFQAHPLHRPVIFLRGRELGTQRVRITQRLAPADVNIDRCDYALLNGRETQVSTLPETLSKISSDICRIRLINKLGVETDVELDICVASDRDIAGVEEEFRRMAGRGTLGIRQIETFISASSQFSSATGYCDGICAYLYGLLAKERVPDSSLPYELYEDKFNKAAEKLAAYERPLARIIASLIEFHFNHFRDSASLFPNSRVSSVAQRYAAWLAAQDQKANVASPLRTAFSLETCVTDFDTEQILLWSARPLVNLYQLLETIESFRERDISEFDRVKLTVLLGETHAQAGSTARALECAKELRNLAGFEIWAEELIQKITSEKTQNA